MSNVMKAVRIEKITFNIGCGTTMNPENARKILDMVSGSKSVITRSRKRSTFNVPKNKPIGCKVTIRKGTNELLKKLFEAKENTLKSTNFDRTGNVCFGIKEYIDIPGIEYDPKIGIMGFDVCVTLERPGYRVKRKKIPKKIGKNHIIEKEEAIDFMKSRFHIKVDA